MKDTHTIIAARDHVARRAFAQSMRDAGHTLDVIGAQLGVSRERVRQITTKGKCASCVDPVALLRILRDPTTDSRDVLAAKSGAYPRAVNECLEALGIKRAALRLMRWRRMAPTRRRYAAIIRAEYERRARTPTLVELDAAFRSANITTNLIRIFGSVNGAMRYVGIPPRAVGSPGHVTARKTRTHCKRGHEFTPENTYRYVHGNRTARHCRECTLLRQAAHRAA